MAARDERIVEDEAGRSRAADHQRIAADLDAPATLRAFDHDEIVGAIVFGRGAGRARPRKDRSYRAVVVAGISHRRRL